MTGNAHAWGSDFAKVDAHVIQPEEYEELPEWTDAIFDAATFYQGGKPMLSPEAGEDT